MTRKPTGKMPEGKGVLPDHKRDRKKLVAPFNYMLGGMQDISYIDSIMPEIVWLALLHEKFGVGEGAELARALSKAAIESVVREKVAFFGHISSYASLSDDERKTILAKLEGMEVLDRLRRVLRSSLQPSIRNARWRFCFPTEFRSSPTGMANWQSSGGC